VHRDLNLTVKRTRCKRLKRTLRPRPLLRNPVRNGRLLGVRLAVGRKTGVSHHCHCFFPCRFRVCPPSDERRGQGAPVTLNLRPHQYAGAAFINEARGGREGGTATAAQPGRRSRLNLPDRSCLARFSVPLLLRPKIRERHIYCGHCQSAIHLGTERRFTIFLCHCA
jgi:hypothetical protein